MTGTAAQQARVYEAIKASHGVEVAADLLDLIPPVDLRIAELRAEMHAEFADVRREMHEQTNRFIQWTFAAVGLSVTISTSVTALLVQHLT